MTPLTQTEIKAARKIAYNFVFDPFNTYRPGRYFKYDGRTRIGNAANQIVQQLRANREGIIDARNKQEHRRENRPYIFQNILKSPLVNDWIKHRPSLRIIDGDHLRANNGRNHWAKDDRDLKILEILAKY